MLSFCETHTATMMWHCAATTST